MNLSFRYSKVANNVYKPIIPLQASPKHTAAPPDDYTAKWSTAFRGSSRHGNDYNLFQASLEAFADVGSRIRLAGFDLKRNPPPLLCGQKVNGLAISYREFLRNLITITRQMVGYATYPVSVL